MTVLNGNPPTGPMPAIHTPKSEPWPSVHRRVLLDPDLAQRVATIRAARTGEAPRHRAGHPAAVPVPAVPAERRLPLLSRLFLAGGTPR